MQKKIWLTITLLLATALITSGCAPENNTTATETMTTTITKTETITATTQYGYTQPLTESEKQALIDIALSTPGAEYLAQQYGYQVDMRWMVITSFNEATGKPYRQVYELDDYERLSHIPNYAIVYPAVLIRYGEPQQRQLRISIDRTSGEVMMVDELVVREEDEILPDGFEPVVTVEVRTTMNGIWRYLAVSADGSIISVYDTGLRMPMPGSEAQRTVWTGELYYGELQALADAFADPTFEPENTYTYDEGSLIYDNHVYISINYQGLEKNIEMYLDPFSRDFMSSSLPEAVKQLCLQLDTIYKHRVDFSRSELLVYDK